MQVPQMDYIIASDASRRLAISFKQSDTMPRRQFSCSKASPWFKQSLLGVLLASSCLIVSASTNGAQEQQHQMRPEARVGGLDPNDYVDEVGEMDIMANQRQIPTAQLMAAAGHVIPENFFLPGGSIPALYSRINHQNSNHHHHHQQQQKQLEPNSAEILQTLASQRNHLRHLIRQHQFNQHQAADSIAEAASEPQQSHEQTSLMDLVEGGEVNSAPVSANQADLASQIGYLGPASLYDQQQHHQQLGEQQLAAELLALMQLKQLQQQQQQQQESSLQAAASDPVDYGVGSPSAMGPAYHISGYGGDNSAPERPFGLPTKSSSKEPPGMLKPLGNPQQISSPVIDLIANAPKGPNLEKLAEKLPQVQTPTVFSFSSSKDPMEKVKGVNQKKRNVMKQAEQFARSVIKSVNDKFGTNLGDQTDIPFLLSSFGPLGFAQNVLFDPTLLVTLLNSAERTYFSDVLPEPAKAAIRPVLNIFRVPNKKRGDKANLSNIISFLASGGRTGSPPPKHRPGTGIERASKAKASSTTS